MWSTLSFPHTPFGSSFQFPVADVKIKICMYYRNREEMTRK